MGKGLLAGGAILWSRLPSDSARESPFQQMQLDKLTYTGKASLATISPDGKYVVHVNSDGAQSSLWVRQVATSSNVEILPASETRFLGQTFSPDGVFIYYVVYEKTSPMGNVYQIPVLGGQPKKIIEDVDSPISFSADGRQFAFIRHFPQSGETALLVANADGSGERKVISRKRPARFGAGTLSGPAWSPKGSLIACPAADLINSVDSHTIVAVDPIRAGNKHSANISGRSWASWRGCRAAMALSSRLRSDGTDFTTSYFSRWEAYCVSLPVRSFEPVSTRHSFVGYRGKNQDLRSACDGPCLHHAAMEKGQSRGLFYRYAR
jgi:hypothetical protein